MASRLTRVVMYSVMVMSYPSASSTMRFFRSAGILMVSVLFSPVASLGGRPLRFIGRPHSLVPYKSG